MILDTLAHADRYTAGNDTLKRAFDYLTATDLTALPTGRIELGEHTLVKDDIEGADLACLLISSALPFRSFSILPDKFTSLTPP